MKANLYTHADALRDFKAGNVAALQTGAEFISRGAARQYRRGYKGRSYITFKHPFAREEFYGLAREAALAALLEWRPRAGDFAKFIYRAVDRALAKRTPAEHGEGPGHIAGSFSIDKPRPDAKGAQGDDEESDDINRAEQFAIRHALGDKALYSAPEDTRADDYTLAVFAEQHEREHRLATAVEPYSRNSVKRYVDQSRRRKDYKSDEDYQRARAQFAAEVERARTLLRVFALWQPSSPTFGGFPPGMLTEWPALGSGGTWTPPKGVRLPRGKEVYTAKGKALLLELRDRLRWVSEQAIAMDEQERRIAAARGAVDRQHESMRQEVRERQAARTPAEQAAWEATRSERKAAGDAELRRMMGLSPKRAKRKSLKQK